MATGIIALNNPINFTDPLGLSAEKFAWDDACNLTKNNFMDTWNNFPQIILDELIGAATWPADNPEEAIMVLLIGKLSFANSSTLSPPFKGKTPTQIDKMFRSKGFKLKGPSPINGRGGYVKPKTGRSYHRDPKNRFSEPPHVDVNRPRGYKGGLPKRKYNL